MKILVTGAAGFIGFHLVGKLLELGYEVVGLDNINDYYDINLKYARLNEKGIAKDQIEEGVYVKSTKNELFRFIKLDIQDKSKIEALFERENFGVVCNLAAQPGVRYSLENPHSYVQNNVVGFLNILEGCRKTEVKHLVFASSSSVYGLNQKIPFSTEENVDFPVSLYAATKKSNELMAHTYSHLYGIPSTGLRFFTVYGPWGRPDMAYFLFTDLILKNKPIRVFNNGNLSRDFTYIDDIVKGLVKVIGSPPSSSKKEGFLSLAPYKIYNIGNNAPVNLLQFIEVIEEKLGKKAEKVFMPMQPGDVFETFADVSDLIADLGYKPSTKLEKGIEEFISWYINYYKV